MPSATAATRVADVLRAWGKPSSRWRARCSVAITVSHSCSCFNAGKPPPPPSPHRSRRWAIGAATRPFVGELSVFDPGPRTSSAITITAVQAVSMERAALRAWIAERPQIAEQLLRVPARRLCRTNNNLADLILTDVPGRVAKQLLALAQRFGTQEDAGLRVTHDLTQLEIAQLVGASRETVNKALADFAHRGWIRLEGKSVLISDSERLAHRAR